ncbi:MAG: DUF4258 domain-containing protein [bacterium]
MSRIKEKVRNRQYIMTFHAEEEMADDNLSIFDIEGAILAGQIFERQKDPTSAEWKYRHLSKINTVFSKYLAAREDKNFAVVSY